MPLPSFKDNFSKQSDQYLRYRPHYPESLYQFIASLTTKNELAWDCGTGNGQAATGLAKFYTRVVATDPSEQQIKNAIACNNVEYRVAKAEERLFETEQVDLISVANALHWFDFDSFYAEAKRALKPNGVIAAWAYGNPSHSPELDRVITCFHDEILGTYWLNENRLVEKEYATVPFPFTEISAPGFKIEKLLTYDDLTGLFSTWSAAQRYRDQTGSDPVANITKQLDMAWPDKTSKKLFTWKLVLKIGRK